MEGECRIMGKQIDNFYMQAHHLDPEDLKSLSNDNILSDKFAIQDEFAVQRKFNGISFLWDGGITRGIQPQRFFPTAKGEVSTGLWTNDAQVIEFPSSLLDKLPKFIPIQGELWCDDNLQCVNSIVRKKIPNDKEWSKIKFVVYDVKPYCLWYQHLKIEIDTWKKIPLMYEVFFGNPIYSERTKLLQIHVFQGDLFQMNEKQSFFSSNKSPLCLIVNYFLWNNARQDMKEYKWEGLMIHTDASYECKRSYNLLKYKQSYDIEGTIIGYKPGKTGKNTYGAIVVQFTWNEKVESIVGGTKEMIGQKIIVDISGLTDKEHSCAEEIYPKGTELKFTFKNISIYGVPQHANIMRGYHEF